MKSPFPGMDPYLETSEFWSGLHNSLSVEIKVQLNKLIGPNYYADIETHASGVDIGTWHSTYPDVGIFHPPYQPETPLKNRVMIPTAPIERAVALPDQSKQRSIRIYLTKTHQLVTTIEILSPVNKRPGDGLEAYQRKRIRLLQSAMHFIELDLLRKGQRPGDEVNHPPVDTDYVLLVNRDRDIGLRVSKIWPLSLSEAFPLLPVPLLPPDDDVPLDLNEAFQTVYAESNYGWRIDYSQPVPTPPLRKPMESWVTEHISNTK